ncbi:hypothetical protein M2323_003566 [Rhodoblastus acidophilus]|uniref:hypothetical protein n=1 Tax=Rhodoblastus acidophilus TaxID=1074 RepID=UPI0022246DA2|nr:hypothetical protein [Rhodoblastus acidophilus]MCW2285617.1 hypothetical protein [Rhodoblastus acidophilus]MCW2334625.1 hypothetical protein [Rhodoblastus acidophilus]
MFEHITQGVRYYDPDPDRVNGSQPAGPSDREFVLWFPGSLDRALHILAQCGDTTSRACQFWLARFDDRLTRAGFLQIWSDARRVDGAWLVPDVLALEWLRDSAGVRLSQCVEIRFSSQKQRDAFIAKAGNASAAPSPMPLIF